MCFDLSLVVSGGSFVDTGILAFLRCFNVESNCYFRFHASPPMVSLIPARKLKGRAGYPKAP